MFFSVYVKRNMYYTYYLFIYYSVIKYFFLLILILVMLMKNISIWKDTVRKKQYPKLGENKEVDVLIVGGGITGVSTLYQLRNSNLKVVLVEQNRIGCAVTGNSTGKLCYLQNDLLDKIKSNFDYHKVLEYIKSQMDGIQLALQIIEDEKINCDLEKVDSYLYTSYDDEVSKLKRLEEFLQNNHIDIKYDDNEFIKSKYMFGVGDTYVFHPLKFVQGLLKKGDYSIYEYTSVKKIEKVDNYYCCYTDKYHIKAKWVVIASHYPYFNLPFMFPIKASLEKSYLSASKYVGDSLSLISYSYPFVSIRTYKDYLIYLNNSHSIEKNVDDVNRYKELLKEVRDFGLEPSYLWSNSDLITNDGLPYIGEIQDNLLIGTGYNTWGLTNGILAGKVLRDIILNESNRYIELFSPKRINLSQVTSGIIDVIKSVGGYIQGYLVKKDNVIYHQKNGKEVMTYQDDNLDHTVYRKCPHMGCQLIFNDLEKTWDCPCHGSRFDIDGKCISGPSNKDILVDE